jgi:hypothetical protein
VPSIARVYFCKFGDVFECGAGEGVTLRGVVSDSVGRELPCSAMCGARVRAERTLLEQHNVMAGSRRVVCRRNVRVVSETGTALPVTACAGQPPTNHCWNNVMAG